MLQFQTTVDMSLVSPGWQRFESSHCGWVVLVDTWIVELAVKQVSLHKNKDLCLGQVGDIQ